ncbi:MAG: hypothetical protein KAI66_12040 [Lentisphaeria bacterium]|nr:hypothetical protein [Lentisphaeria bacterium]
MKTIFLLLLALPALFLACSTDQNLCQADTCAPHGTCVIGNEGPSCVCDEFYQPGPNPSCIPAPTQLVGQRCVEDDNCISNMCLKYEGDSEGYCYSRDCTSNTECVNHAAGETNEMCCVEVGAAYFICMKIAEGYDCGGPEYRCGTSCTGNPDICGPTRPCMGDGLDDPNAICSQMCTTDNDCANCEWNKDPHVEFACVTISGGDRYCLLDFAVPCTTGADCIEDETCTIDVSPDMTDLFGKCMNVGGMPPGSECNDGDDPNNLSYEERCSGFYCLGGMCSEVCVEDTDCPEGMICEVLRFSNVDDEILVCMGNKSCDGPADCAEGESCWPTLRGNHLTGWCRANEGTDPVGTECTDAGDTCEVFCLEPLCTEWCTLDADCPEGMGCETIDFCFVEPCDDPENMAAASVCTAA